MGEKWIIGQQIKYCKSTKGIASHLKNPGASPDAGPLAFASLCLVDNEINLLFRNNLTEADDQKFLHAIVDGLKRYFPGFSDQFSWVRREDTDMFIIHPPVRIDLDDVTSIIGSVPELETSGWIHDTLAMWKVENQHRIKPSVAPESRDSALEGRVQTPPARSRKE